MAARSVVQVSFEGDYIQTYPSIQSACDATGISRSVINRMIDEYRFGRKDKFLWLDIDEYLKIIRPRGTGHPISQHRNTKKEPLIADYDSITEASKATNISVSVINRILKGNISTDDKFIWKYLDLRTDAHRASILKYLRRYSDEFEDDVEELLSQMQIRDRVRPTSPRPAEVVVETESSTQITITSKTVKKSHPSPTPSMTLKFRITPD